MYLEKYGDSSNAVFVYVAGNKIWIQKKVNGSDTFIDKGSYNSSTHKFFRIRESSGTMYFDTSTDGTSWTNLHSFANPFAITAIKIGVAAGTYQAEGDIN